MGGEKPVVAGALDGGRISDGDDGPGRHGTCWQRFDDNSGAVCEEHSQGGRLFAGQVARERADRRPAVRQSLYLRPWLLDAVPVAGPGRGRGRGATAGTSGEAGKSM